MSAGREWWGADVIPRKRWRIEVPLGVQIPDGYGIVEYLMDRGAVIVMPVPLNALVAGWRDFVRWLRFPPGRDAVYREGRIAERAWREGYDAAMWERGCSLSMRVAAINPYGHRIAWRQSASGGET